MIDVGKVKSNHTRRDAIVYVRQSHPSQVENNRESTARQYALVEKAVALGWAKSQVTIIDEDLGVSGKVFVKRYEVGPLGGYERATSIGQNQNQIWLALMTTLPKDC